MFRAAVEALDLSVNNPEAEPGGDYYVVTERAEGLTDHLFVGKRPVELGAGSTEGDPALERRREVRAVQLPRSGTWPRGRS